MRRNFAKLKNLASPFRRTALAGRPGGPGYSLKWRFLNSRAFIALTLAAVALVMVAAPGPGGGCKVHASDTLPSDYCYQYNYTVSYTGSTALTNTAVRVPVNAQSLVLGDRMDPRGWDLLPVLGSLSNEVDLLTQDLTSPAAYWWLHIPSITQDQTRTVRVYLGSDEQKRDQGILFTGQDVFTVPDNAAFDLADDFTVQVELELLDDTARNENIISHLDPADAGFAIDLVDDAGTLKVRCTADTTTAEITWDSMWTNTNRRIELIMDSGGSGLTCRDVESVGGTSSTASGAVSASVEDFIIGSGLQDAIVRRVIMRNDSTGAYQARYDFNANQITETSSTNPFTGTVTDGGPNTLPGTYTFNRDQDDFDVSVGALQFTSAADYVVIPTNNPDVLGSPWVVDIADSVAETQDGLLHTLFIEPVAGSVDGAAPREMGLALAMGGLGLVLGLFTYRASGYAPLALFVFGLPIGAGMIQGWVQPWWAMMWGFLVISSWFAVRQSEAA